MDWGWILAILLAALGIAVSIRGFRTAKPQSSGKVIHIHAARARSAKSRNAISRFTGLYGTKQQSVTRKAPSILAGLMAKLAKRRRNDTRTHSRTYGKTRGKSGFTGWERTGGDGQPSAADVLPKVMAHELNSLLTPIMGYSGMLRTRLDENDPIRADIDEIYASSKRAKELIQRFSTKEAKTPDTTFYRLNLDEMIPRVVRVAELAKPGHAQIFSDIDFKGGQVMGNSAQISQVILNLFTNAFQATKRHGGIIWIRGGIEERNDGKFARISVADDGVGIPGSNIGKVFEPFFTTKRDSEGAGLGLSILREIIARHGGTVRAASAPGKSTVFIVYIPIIGSVNTKGTADTVPTDMEKAGITCNKRAGHRPELPFADYLRAVCDGERIGSATGTNAANTAVSGRSGAMGVMNSGNHGLETRGNTINNTQIGGAFFEPGLRGARPRGVFRLRVLRGGADAGTAADDAITAGNAVTGNRGSSDLAGLSDLDSTKSAETAERAYVSAKAEGLRRGLQLLPRAGVPANLGGVPAWYGLLRSDQARAAYDDKSGSGREIPSGIVVVDEDAWALDTVERALTSGGYGARAYPDAEKAFGALLKEPCRVLIVAGRMKHGDGRAFAERVKKAGCASNVIMMAEAAEENNVYGMLRNGKIDGYVKKPLTVGELMDKVGAIMDTTDTKH